MNNLSLHGKVIIVTGGGRGLGLAMVRGLAGAGANVVVPTHIQSDVDDISRSGDALDDAAGGSILPILVDLRDPTQCQDAVGQTISHFGAVHGLINNAGVAPAFIAPDHDHPDKPRPKFWDTRDDIVQTVIATNYVAANRMASLVAPHLVAGGWGRIINVTTMIETMHRTGFSCYGASKAALEMASEIWHQDLAGTGVSVNILNPGGPADTEGLALARREATRMGAMGPLVVPEKMAAPAIWLCSDESDGISGMRYDADPWDAAQPPGTEAERIGRPLGLRLIPLE